MIAYKISYSLCSFKRTTFRQEEQMIYAFLDFLAKLDIVQFYPVFCPMSLSNIGQLSTREIGLTIHGYII